MRSIASLQLCIFSLKIFSQLRLHVNYLTSDSSSNITVISSVPIKDDLYIGGGAMPWLLSRVFWGGGERDAASCTFNEEGGKS